MEVIALVRTIIHGSDADSVASVLRFTGSGSSINSDEGYYTPLTAAVHWSRIGTVAALCHRPDLDLLKPDKDGETPLTRSAEKDNGSLELLLLHLPPDALSVSTLPIHIAAAAGNLNAVALLLSKGASTSLVLLPASLSVLRCSVGLCTAAPI